MNVDGLRKKIVDLNCEVAELYPHTRDDPDKWRAIGDLEMGITLLKIGLAKLEAQK